MIRLYIIDDKGTTDTADDVTIALLINGEEPLHLTGVIPVAMEITWHIHQLWLNHLLIMELINSYCYKI